MENVQHEQSEIDQKVHHLLNSYTRLLTLDKIFEKVIKELKINEDRKEEYKYKM